MLAKAADAPQVAPRDIELDLGQGKALLNERPRRARWHFTISRHSTGKASAPATRLNSPSAQSAIEPNGQGLFIPRWYVAHDVKAGMCAQENWQRLRGFNYL